MCLPVRGLTRSPQAPASHYYFGDKDAHSIFAVLEWVYEEICEHERKLDLQGCRQAAPFANWSRAPSIISPSIPTSSLLNDENRAGTRHVHESKQLEAMHSPLVSMVSRILR